MDNGKLLVEKLVEAQLKTWKTRMSKEEKEAEKRLSVVTVCMEPGSGGSIVAQEIAKQLDFDFFHHDIITRLIDQGLDIIGFSLAGVDEKNDRIRKGTPIKKVLECIEEIHRVKQKYASATPAIHIAYMLLHSGLDELERLPEFLSHTGADQTVVSSDGSISPCVMKQIPVKGANYYYSRGQKKLQTNLSYGNIHTDSLNTIWHRREYRQFVRSFQKDKAPNICRNCQKEILKTLVKVSRQKV